MRIYLDNAATSWPKPEPVYAAVDRYQRQVGAAAGRGAYRDAVEAQRIVDEARRRCGSLLGISDPNRLVFGSNGTDVLNLAIHGLLRTGDHVVTTVCEHNSVLRPLAELARVQGVEVSHVRCNESGYIAPNDIEAAIRPNTKLIAVTHASNVTGAIQPIEAISQVARTITVLVDAAQTFGHVPINVRSLDVDLLAASGHKGLLGPLGTGVLYIRPGLEKLLSPVRQGGTGVNSTDDHQPDELPYRYEAGNLNTAALAGVVAAAQFLEERTVEAIAAHEDRLVQRLCSGLRAIPNLRVYGPGDGQPRAAVVSFSVEGYDPQDFAAALDGSFGVQCRAGLHCAPLMHQSLRTDRLGGLVRLSPGWATTPAEVDLALGAIEAIASA